MLTVIAQFAAHDGTMSGVWEDQAELELLIELAFGAKTFEQVNRDAARFGLQRLVHSNASRGISERLKELTGISKESLSFFPIRCKPEAATHGDKMLQPFVLLSSIVEKCLQEDECFFAVSQTPTHPETVAVSNKMLLVYFFR